MAFQQGLRAARAGENTPVCERCLSKATEYLPGAILESIQAGQGDGTCARCGREGTVIWLRQQRVGDAPSTPAEHQGGEELQVLSQLCQQTMKDLATQAEINKAMV